MPVNAFKDIRASVRRQLQDLDGNYWTDDDIDAYINEGQFDFCKQTKCLRAQAPITSLTNLETYDLPEDFLEALRLETADGTELKQCDWEHIQAIAGNNWRSSVGNPEYWFSDLDGHKKFRMYPRPSPTAEVSGVEFDGSNVFQPNNFSVKSLYAPTTYAKNGQIYVLSGGVVSAFSESVSKVNQTKQVVSSLPSDFVPGQIVVHTNRLNSVSTPPQLLALGFVTGYEKRIYSIDLATGATTLLVSWASGALEVSNLWNVDSSTCAWVIYSYQTSAGVYTVYASKLDTFSAVSIGVSSATRTDVPSGVVQDRTFYCDLDSTHTTKTLFSLSSAATSSLTTSAYAGAIYRMLSFGTTTAEIACFVSSIGVSRLSDDAAIIPGYITYPVGAARDIVFYTTYDPVTYETTAWVQKISTGAKESFDLGDCSGAALAAVTSSGYVLLSSRGLFDSVYELGCVVDIDSLPFLSDEGVVIDIVDDEASIVFDSDYGAVVQIIEDEDAYNLWYIRAPVQDEVELSDPRALEDYALMKCYYQDKDTQSFNKGNSYAKSYAKLVAQEQTKLSGAYLRGSIKRPVIHTF